MLDEISLDDLAELLRGDDERRRWLRDLIAWAIVSLANMELRIQASIAAGQVPEAFSMTDVLGEDAPDMRELVERAERKR